MMAIDVMGADETQRVNIKDADAMEAAVTANHNNVSDFNKGNIKAATDDRTVCDCQLTLGPWLGPIMQPKPLPGFTRSLVTGGGYLPTLAVG